MAVHALAGIEERVAEMEGAVVLRVEVDRIDETGPEGYEALLIGKCLVEQNIIHLDAQSRIIASAGAEVAASVDDFG